MGDFVAFSEDADVGMEYLEHHGILGQRWGHKNGPPYPLGSGDHSSGEKSAAKAAGITIGSSSGKGSITKLKRFGSSSKSPDKPASPSTAKNAPKKEMTDEEKRQAAIDAARSGDKKKIAKYVDYLSTDELREAQARAQMKDQLTRKDPEEQKASKAEMEKQEAIRSGDKEKVKEYADKMSYQELREAMDKVDLTTKLNKVDPPPTALDKINEVANKVDRLRDAAEKGIKAYNVIAQVYNSTHKDGPQWPEIHAQQQSKEQKKEADVLDKLAKNAMKDVAKGVEETKQQQQKKEQSYKERKEQELKNKQMDYEYEKKYREWVKDQEKGKKTEQELNEKVEQKRVEEESRPAPTPTPSNPTNYSQYTQRLSDYDNTPSYEELIPDDVRDVMNRKVV